METNTNTIIITTNTQTLVLTGEEIHIHFTSAFPYFWLRNDGGYTVRMSLSPNIEEGKDGVIEVLAGSSAGTMHGYDATRSDLYLLGSGKVQVMGTYTPENPFKKDVKGGGSSDNIRVVNFGTKNLILNSVIGIGNTFESDIVDNFVRVTVPADLKIAWYPIVGFYFYKNKMYRLVVKNFTGYGRIGISNRDAQNPYSTGSGTREEIFVDRNAAGFFENDNHLCNKNDASPKLIDFFAVPNKSYADESIVVSEISGGLWYCSDDNRENTNSFSFDIALYEEI